VYSLVVAAPFTFAGATDLVAGTAVGTTGFTVNANLVATLPTPSTNYTYRFNTITGGGTLPAGLTINATTGAITGTPTTPGTYNVTIRYGSANAAGTTWQASTYTDYPLTFKVVGTVNFNLNYSDSPSVASQTYLPGAQLTLPSPVRAGYVFTGWYTDEAATVKYAPVIAGTTAATTLYAGWVEIAGHETAALAALTARLNDIAAGTSNVGESAAKEVADITLQIIAINDIIRTADLANAATALASARTALETAIASGNTASATALSNAVTSLETAIASGNTASANALATKATELIALIDAVSDDLDALDTALTAAIASGDAASATALANAKTALETAIAAGNTASANALAAKATELIALIDAVSDDLTALDTALTAAIASGDAASATALANAKTALETAIANGDTAAATALAAKATELTDLINANKTKIGEVETDLGKANAKIDEQADALKGAQAIGTVGLVFGIIALLAGAAALVFQFLIKKRS
jgi:uncharacterized repeat protein (TIGR02543 family)